MASHRILERRWNFSWKESKARKPCRSRLRGSFCAVSAARVLRPRLPLALGWEMGQSQNNTVTPTGTVRSWGRGSLASARGPHGGPGSQAAL